MWYHFDMLDIYGTLEISEVLNEIVTFSHTELAKNKLLNQKMLSLENASKALLLVSQMSDYILKYGSLPIRASFDLEKFVEISLKGGVLSALELDHIALDCLTSNNLLTFFTAFGPSPLPE